MIIRYQKYSQDATQNYEAGGCRSPKNSKRGQICSFLPPYSPGKGDSMRNADLEYSILTIKLKLSTCVDFLINCLLWCHERRL